MACNTMQLWDETVYAFFVPILLTCSVPYNVFFILLHSRCDNFMSIEQFLVILKFLLAIICWIGKRLIDTFLY